jgi:hypothetical protein
MSTINSTFIVDMRIKYVYLRCMRIAYGYNRHEKDFDGLDIDPDMFTLDDKKTFEDQRQVLGAWLREFQRRKTEGVVVVILDNGDLGRGAGAAQFRKMITDTGATIEGPKDRPSAGSKGRPERPHLTEDQEQKVCALWNGNNFRQSTLISIIKRDYGVELNRDQLNYICKRKPARKAAAAKKTTK